MDPVTQMSNAEILGGVPLIAGADAALLSGIPLDEESFEATQWLDGGFARRFTAWDHYRRDVVNFWLNLAQYVTRFGGLVIARPTEASLTQASSTHRWIILVSHADGSARVEWTGRMCSPSEMAGMLAPSFKGIIDLAACHAPGLPQAIKDRLPDSSVRYTQDEILHPLSLSCLAYVVQSIDQCQGDYVESWRRAAIRLETFLATQGDP